MSDFARTSDSMHLFMQIAVGFICTKYTCLRTLICGVEPHSEREKIAFGCQVQAGWEELEPNLALEIAAFCSQSTAQHQGLAVVFWACLILIAGNLPFSSVSRALC